MRKEVGKGRGRGIALTFFRPHLSTASPRALGGENFLPLKLEAEIQARLL
jgi:hypothetical protein